MTSRLSRLHIDCTEARNGRCMRKKYVEKAVSSSFVSRKCLSSHCVTSYRTQSLGLTTVGRRFLPTHALERNTHLYEIFVQDFAIMKEQTIRLDPGLNIITGQSGSGKSIFLEVIAQLCGAGAGEEFIRSGAESALIRGKFNIGSDVMSDVCNILSHHNVPADRYNFAATAKRQLSKTETGAKSEPVILSCQLQIERRLTFVDVDDGNKSHAQAQVSSRMMTTAPSRRVRSACRINDTQVPLKALRELGRVLVDFNGQGTASHLAEEQFQLKILDAVGGTFDLRRRFVELSSHLRAKQYESSNLVGMTAKERKELESLIHDVNLVRPAVDEDVTLRTMLRHLDGIDATLEETARLSTMFDGGGNGTEAGIKSSLRYVTSQLTALLANARHVTKNGADPDIKASNHQAAQENADLQAQLIVADTRTDEAFLGLEDALSKCREAELLILDAQSRLLDYANLIRVDQVKREACITRLRELERLCNRIGVQSSAEAQESAKVAIEVIGNADYKKAKRSELQKKIRDIEAQVFATGLELSKARKSAAAAVCESVSSTITSLGMEGSRFDISIWWERPDVQSHDTIAQTYPAPGPDAHVGDMSVCKLQKGGLDRVEFFLSTGPNEALRPVGTVASGGEMCRLLLAIKLSPLARKEVKQRGNRKSDLNAPDDVEMHESLRLGTVSIFDELDSGVGGRIGTQIGEALSQLTKSGTQVICVTHLPQVAAHGNLHLRVSKHITTCGTKDQKQASYLQRVEIKVDTLQDEEAQILEISNMLGLGDGHDGKQMATYLLEAARSDEKSKLT